LRAGPYNRGINVVSAAGLEAGAEPAPPATPEQGNPRQDAEADVGFRTSDHVKRRAMPVRSSIHWKPLRDSHYVVASLEPGQGGRRQLFVKQATLVHVQQLVRGAHAQPALGLLLGHRWECPITGTSYLSIESLAEGGVARDESALETAMSVLVAQFRSHDGLERVGWYVGAPSLEQRALARTHAAVHAAWFPEPWQSTLVVADSGAAGAFYLHDRMAMRWFQSPFYEELEPSKKPPATKATSVSWPNYLTSDSVAPLPVRAPVEARPAPPARLPPRPAVVPRMSSATEATTARADRSASPPAGPSIGRLAARVIGSSLRHVRGAVLFASKSFWRMLQHASSHLGRAIAQHGPAVRVAFARGGKSMASGASSMARASLGTLARGRAASSRLLEEGAARRRAALARAAEAAAQRAEAARAAAARRQAEAARAATERRELEAARAAAAREAAAVREAEAARVAAARREAEAAQVEAVRVEAARREAEAAQAATMRQQAEAARAAARREAEALAREQAELARRNADAARKPVDVPVIAEPTARSRSAAAVRPASNGIVPAPSAAVPTATASAADLEDTAASDAPFRYLALASRDGFALITNSQTPDQSDFWLLEDADSGMLLSVVTSDVGVRGAVLHYNLRTDDEGLLQRTRPEHRDLASRTIYARELAVEGLRARTQRLRATGALVREWKISPPIDLPLPSGSGERVTGSEAGDERREAGNG
jgi:hypothetical protein